MQRLTNALNVLLRLCECGALIAVAFALIKISALARQAENTFARLEAVSETLPGIATKEIDTQIKNLRTDSVNQIALTRSSLDKQLTTLNSTLAGELSKTRVGILNQTKSVSGALATTIHSVNDLTIPAVNSAINNAKTVEDNVNAIVINPDIPKVIRDIRLTAAFAGQTMVHVETTSDAIAKAAPATASAVSGISVDVHSLSSAIAKPQPLWKRVLSVFTSGAAIYSKF